MVRIRPFIELEQDYLEELENMTDAERSKFQHENKTARELKHKWEREE